MIPLSKLYVVEVLVALFVLGCAVASGDLGHHAETAEPIPGETRR